LHDALPISTRCASTPIAGTDRPVVSLLWSGLSLLADRKLTLVRVLPLESGIIILIYHSSHMNLLRMDTHAYRPSHKHSASGPVRCPVHGGGTGPQPDCPPAPDGGLDGAAARLHSTAFAAGGLRSQRAAPATQRGHGAVADHQQPHRGYQPVPGSGAPAEQGRCPDAEAGRPVHLQ